MQHYANRSEYAAEALCVTGWCRNKPCIQCPATANNRTCTYSVKQEIINTAYGVCPNHDVQADGIKPEPALLKNFERDYLNPSNPVDPSTHMSGGLYWTEEHNRTALPTNFESDSFNPPNPTKTSTQLSGRLIGADRVKRPVRTGDENHRSFSAGLTVKNESENHDACDYETDILCVKTEVTDTEVHNCKRVRSEPESMCSASDKTCESLDRPDLYPDPFNPLILRVPATQLYGGRSEAKRVNTLCNGSMNSLESVASSFHLTGQQNEASRVTNMLQASFDPVERSSHEQPGVNHSERENRVLQVKQEPVFLKQEWAEKAVTDDQVTFDPHWSHEQVVSQLVFERKPDPYVIAGQQISTKTNWSCEEVISELGCQGKPDPDAVNEVMVSEPLESYERVVSEVVLEGKPGPNGSGFASKITSNPESDLPTDTSSDYSSDKESKLFNTDTCHQLDNIGNLTTRHESAHCKVRSDDILREQFGIRDCSVQLLRLPPGLHQNQGTVVSIRTFHLFMMPSADLGREQFKTKRIKTKGKTAASKMAAQRVPVTSVQSSSQGNVGLYGTKRGRSKTAASTGTTCDLCETKFSSLGNLSKHIQTKHQNHRPYECHLCDRRFAFPSHLADHVRLHTGERPFACSQCQLKFSRKSHLTSHTRTHTGEKRYPCQHCPAKFDRKYSLNCHLGTVHKLAEFISDASDRKQKYTFEKRTYTCELCSKTFLYLSHLKSHIVKHSQSKPFVCNTCGKGCSSTSDLAKHKRLHSGVRPYKCELCEEAFMQAGCLTRHMARCHPAVFKERHMCKHCGRKFALPSGLTRHMFTHAKLD